MALVPIVSPVFVVIPAGVSLWLHGNRISTIVIVAIHVVASFVDSSLYNVGLIGLPLSSFMHMLPHYNDVSSKTF